VWYGNSIKTLCDFDKNDKTFIDEQVNIKLPDCLLIKESNRLPDVGPPFSVPAFSGPAITAATLWF